MKEKVILVVILLLLMSLLPFIVTKCANNKSTSNTVVQVTTQNNTVKQNNQSFNPKATDFENIVALTANKYSKNYSDNTTKAIAIIIHSNYIANKSAFKNSDYMYEQNASQEVKQNYNKIKELVNSVKENTLCYKHKVYYVPIYTCSNGFTNTNNEYPYLTSVASPWDSFAKCAKDDKSIGVSINGIDYLCKNGYSYSQALLWYLPKMSISN